MTKTSHAQGLLMLYKGWFKLIHEQIDERNEIQDLLRDLKMSFPELEEKIFSLRGLNIDYGLLDFGINQENIDSIASLVDGNLANDPFYKDVNSIKFILQGSL